MLTIHKYPLDFTSGQDHVQLPLGGQPIHYAMQHGVLMVWCEVDDTLSRHHSLLEVHFIGTGHSRGHLPENFHHAATVMPSEGLVLHIYARLS